MSEEAACEHLSPALQTSREESTMIGGGGADRTETVIQDIEKRSLESHTSEGSSSRSESDIGPNGNLANPNSNESDQEFQKITKEQLEELGSEQNGEKLIDDVISSAAIKIQMEGGKRPQLKALETRSQYHSIQQLSSPSIKSNTLVTGAPHISYKISDIVTPSGFYGESGRHSFGGCNRKNMETATQSSEDDDEIEAERGAKKALPNGQVMDHGWSAHDTQNPVVHRNQYEFSDDDEEEFLRSKMHCDNESFDDLSDMEMSDGGSGSHDGSADDAQQREAPSNVEDSSQGQGVADEFVLSDVGFEEKMEAKRARVENIIKTMTPLHKGALNSFPICRSFSAVSSKLSENNRDKEFSPGSVHDQAAELRRPKRKQYIPQQVDPRGEQLDLPPAAKVCITERDAVCNELLKMQEGFNEMQQKYKQMLDCDHDVSFGFSDREDYKENSRVRSEKGCGLSDVNQNDVKSVSKEFRRAFNIGGEWMFDLTNENTKEFGLNGSVTNLEQLTEILKTEITTGVERLVDNFLKTFLKKYLQNASRDGRRNTDMSSRKGAAPISVNDDGFAEQDLRVKDEAIKMENHLKDKGHQPRGDLSGARSKAKDDFFSGSDNNHAQEDVLMLTRIRDSSNVSECKIKASTPLTFTTPSYHTVSRTDADVSSHLPTIPPPPPPLTMQPPFQIHSSISDGGHQSLTCERNKPAEKYREHYFNTHNGSPFGIQQSHLSLFGPPHPHLYYSPCIGKFPSAFVKEQEQMEPLPLIVGAPKKPKRSKVIDRVSPRAVRSVPQETATQSDDGSRQLQDSPGRSFHPSPRFHPAGPVHDAFPHPSLLPFGLSPSVALHNPSLQQHSTLLQAMYSQIPSISHRGEKPSSLSSPSRKTQSFSSSTDMASVPKSFQKCDASIYDQMMSDSMMTVGSSHGFISFG